MICVYVNVLLKTLDGIHTARCLKQIENHRMPKSSGVPLPSGPMIIPTSAPDKSLNAVWLKDNELEPRRIESREDAARLQRAMSHLQESGWHIFVIVGLLFDLWTIVVSCL